jgi:hypothetical protein
MKVIAEVFEIPGGNLLPAFYCIDDDGTSRQEVTNTLVDAICEASGYALDDLKSLLKSAKAGTYVPKDQSLPDWGINDKNFWLPTLETDAGNVLISNENTVFSADEGNLQRFSFSQIFAAIDHWERFLETIQRNGIEAMVGKKFETEI